MPLIIENRALKVGVDPDKGGAICWLSRGASPDNLLNAFDCGRLIQQSYYGRDDGSDWAGCPWRWNPVQGGSWQGAAARVLECAAVCSRGGADGGGSNAAAAAAPDRIRVASIPRNWAGQQLCADVVMRSEITLQPDHAHAEFFFEYSGDVTHPPRIQELPAVFAARRLARLAFYGGAAPWTGAPLAEAAPGFPNEDFRMAEGWAAWVDPATGEGLGVFVPWCR